MIDLFTEIMQTLRHNKMRTFLTGIAVAWGIFMLIVLLGMSRGLLNGATDSLDDGTMRSITVWGGMSSKPYKGFREGRVINLEDTDLPSISGKTKTTVKSTVGAISVNDTVSSATEYVTGNITGVAPESKTVDHIELTGGRYINHSDMKNRRRVIVLESHNAEVLFGQDVDKALGQQVKMRNLSWLVVGVYKSEWRRESITPYTTLRALNGGESTIDEIHVMLDENIDMEGAVNTETAVKQTLAKNHNFSAEDPSAVWIANRFTSLEQQMAVFGIMRIAIWVIGLLTLLSGIVGVSNIMFVSVRERTHEIGVRRAIGAKRRSILTQVVAESVAITTLFGYLGIICGILITAVFSFFNVPESTGIKNPTIDITIAIEVTVVLVVVGALAGLFPAVKATRIHPVEALRDE